MMAVDRLRHSHLNEDHRPAMLGRPGAVLEDTRHLELGHSYSGNQLEHRESIPSLRLLGPQLPTGGKPSCLGWRPLAWTLTPRWGSFAGRSRRGIRTVGTFALLELLEQSGALFAGLRTDPKDGPGIAPLGPFL